MKKIFYTILSVVVVSALLLTSCQSGEEPAILPSAEQNESKPFFDNSFENEVSEDIDVEYATLDYSISYKSTDITEDFEESSAVKIQCNKTSATIDGTGAEVNGSDITILAGGAYILSGTLDGRIIVNSTDDNPIRLILTGITVTCQTSSPLYVISADKVVLTLGENTVNTFKDGTSYVYDDVENEEPSATIFSKDDLTINGKGTLNVEASFKNGIQCKDKLKICGGNINVTAKSDGIKGKDCVGICGGNITVNAGADGIQSSNADDGNVGFVNISDGNVKITSALDGIQGEKGVCISGGTVEVKSGNGKSNESQKGIKGDLDITVTGGSIDAISTDDGLHSNGKINIEGGKITVSSGDDGFHADEEINIKSGTINISRSYEGLEAAKINVSGGNTVIYASDDGVNASDGTGGGFGGMGGGMSANSNYLFNVSGGFLYVNANGDGLDSNGNVTISGGTVLCEGPTNGGNSSFDHNGALTVTGGLILSLGSSGMAGEILSSTSGTTQCIFGSYTNGASGTTLAVKDSQGNVLLVFKTSKQYGHLVFSSPTLKTGETYEIWTGGDGSGECINGLYTNNSYTGGSSVASITQSSTVIGGGGMGGGMGGGGRPQKPGRW